jgi:GNAT superfamily N-acetyltransferase
MYATNLAHTGFAEFPVMPHRLNVMPVRETIFQLTEDDLAEAFDFLTAPQLNSVIMYGFLADNGLSVKLNRGEYYGFRNSAGELEGLALIGHSTVFDTRSDAATEAFARLARRSVTPINMIMAANNQADGFFDVYSEGMYQPRKRCIELAFETRFPFTVPKCPHNVRLARPSEIDEISRAQAELAFIESGINPLAIDAEGFRRRVMRRIEMGRIYVVVENGKLIFKADLMAATDEAAYVEGVYVAPDERGRGTGSACLSTVCMDLLRSSSSVHLLSNVELAGAHSCFVRAGFKQTGRYTTLFV